MEEQSTTSDVIARALEAYQTIALCESWLALDATRREAARRASQEAVAYAQARARALAEEGRDVRSP